MGLGWTGGKDSCKIFHLPRTEELRDPYRTNGWSHLKGQGKAKGSNQDLVWQQLKGFISETTRKEIWVANNRHQRRGKARSLGHSIVLTEFQ